jgi:hypothetical protein
MSDATSHEDGGDEADGESPLVCVNFPSDVHDANECESSPAAFPASLFPPDSDSEDEEEVHDVQLDQTGVQPGHFKPDMSYEPPMSNHARLIG